MPKSDNNTCGVCGKTFDPGDPRQILFHKHRGFGRGYIEVDIPDSDFDVNLRFPSGEIVVIQVRPSNADKNYAGSLDIILPRNQSVCTFYGDDMSPPKGSLVKQIVTEIPA